MKPALFGPIFALLVGASTFGIYKSVDLSRQNEVLESALLKSNEELSLTKKSLSENRAARIQVEEDLNAMQVKMAQQDRQIAQLNQKIKETSDENAAMTSDYSILADRIIRLQFDNSEMSRKLSSIVELKRAIKVLKSRSPKQKIYVNKEVERKPVRVEPASKPARTRAPKAVKQAPRPPVKPKPVVKKAPKSESQNEGFLLKDGKSTFENLVEINVTPAETIISEEAPSERNE